MNIVRRILGALIILIGLAGLALAIWFAVNLQPAADRLEANVASGMDFGLEALGMISETLQVTLQTVSDTSLILDAAVASSERTGETLEALRPAVQDLSDIVAFQLPDNIQAIRDTMPALEQAATAIDSTLRTLAGFQWSTTIPLINYEFGFGLGIEYDPPVPLDQSITEVDQALAELPMQLTGIQASLLSTRRNLSDTAASVAEVGESLKTVGQDLDTVAGALGQYFDLLERANSQLQASRSTIRQQIRSGRTTLTIVLIWLALSQLAPLYLGLTLLLDRPQR